VRRRGRGKKERGGVSGGRRGRGKEMKELREVPINDRENEEGELFCSKRNGVGITFFTQIVKHVD
jgi:hypothetical protein